eukprot:7047022-Pyramimonas_sp.AAC.1
MARERLDRNVRSAYDAHYVLCADEQMATAVAEAMNPPTSATNESSLDKLMRQHEERSRGKAGGYSPVPSRASEQALPTKGEKERGEEALRTGTIRTFVVMLSMFFAGWMFGYVWEATEQGGFSIVALAFGVSGTTTKNQPFVGVLLSTLGFGFTLGLLFSSHLGQIVSKRQQ